MYFVRYEPIKTRLRNRELSDREALPYLVVSSVITVLGSFFITLVPQIGPANHWDLAVGLTSVILVVYGLVYVYRKNGASEGYDFIHKLIVLGWVVAVRFVTGVLIFSTLFFIILGLAKIVPPVYEGTSWFDVVFVFLLYFIFFQRLGRHMQDTHQSQGTQ